MKKEYLQFEKMEIWKQSRELVKHIFGFTKGLSDRDFNSQIHRAALSIMNNVAEGHESGSAKAFARYLKIAKGSCGEVRSLLYAGLDVKYISSPTFDQGYERTLEISRMIAGFIKRLQRDASEL